ncbi:MAG TPA: 4Fe-4S dicluster domain-containing protein [Streptosporangiaceae bacterium]
MAVATGRAPVEVGERVVFPAEAIDELIQALRVAGYQVAGPTVRDQAIVLAEITSADELPWGWGVTLAGGTYRLRRRADRAAFSHSAGPQAWKPFLHPARVPLWSADRDGAIEPAGDGQDGAGPPRYAFLGVRPCDLRAIEIQDRVLMGGRYADSTYAGRRSRAFIVVVNCVEPGETCFCVSMGTGPGADRGYDIALTEIVGDGEGEGEGEGVGDGRGARGGHRFVAEAGSAGGAEILAQVAYASADEPSIEAARAGVAAAAGRMGRAMDTDGLPEMLAATREAARWDEVADRCLTCGNCTMVCPTCFCTGVEDVTDLTGDHAERWRTWASCFDIDFSYVHGGSVRTSAKSRYRQWLTHKLGTWHDQFGSSGCVGCGRCIVWCPVGIDLTEEVAALREEL